MGMKWKTTGKDVDCYKSPALRAEFKAGSVNHMIRQLRTGRLFDQMVMRSIVAIGSTEKGKFCPMAERFMIDDNGSLETFYVAEGRLFDGKMNEIVDGVPDEETLKRYIERRKKINSLVEKILTELEEEHPTQEGMITAVTTAAEVLTAVAICYDIKIDEAVAIFREIYRVRNKMFQESGNGENGQENH